MRSFIEYLNDLLNEDSYNITLTGRSLGKNVKSSKKMFRNDFSDYKKNNSKYEYIQSQKTPQVVKVQQFHPFKEIGYYDMKKQMFYYY